MSIISKFENLPNELLLFVLAYCRPRDLFISLFNLNARLNGLISVQTLRIDLSNVLPKHVLDIYYKSVLPYAREQIRSLRLSDTYGRMGRFVDETGEEGIDFETREIILNQIKTLILWDPTITSLNRIIKHVHNLEYLHMISIGRARRTPHYSDGLIKHLFAMISLKRLHLVVYYPISFDNDIGTSTSLTHVTLNECGMQHLPLLLRRMPNIVKLHVKCDNRPGLFSVNPQPFDHSPYDGLADCVPHLTELTLDVFHTPFNEVEILLRQLPNLIKFTFSSLLIEDYTDGNNWERVIRTYLPQLIKLSLFIDVTIIPAHILIDLDHIIQSFDNSFWQHWPIVVDYFSIRSTSKRHLMLYTLPSQKDILRTCLYGIETRTTCVLGDEEFCHNQKFAYKKISELHFILHSNSPSIDRLPDRIYPNLKVLSFSSQLTEPITLETDTILIDLERICSTSTLSTIKRISLNDQIYPTNFLSKLVERLPNLYSMRVPVSLLNLSVTLPQITSLTLDFNPTHTCRSTDILHRIDVYLPNIRYLYLELSTPEEIYILLSFCLRKMTHLVDIHIVVHKLNAHIDRSAFVTWFVDYKQLNGLSNKIQVEFDDNAKRLLISM